MFRTPIHKQATVIVNLRAEVQAIVHADAIAMCAPAASVEDAEPTGREALQWYSGPFDGRKPSRKPAKRAVGLVRPVQSPVAVPEHLLPDSVCGCCGAVVSRVGCNVCE
jgi:hypothetical protein